MIVNSNSELFYATAMANSKIRMTLQTHMKEMTFNSPLSRDIVTFFTDENRVVKQYRPVELRSYLTGNYGEEEITHIFLSNLVNSSNAKHL